MGQRVTRGRIGTGNFYLPFLAYTLFVVLMAARPVVSHAQAGWATDEGLEISGLVLDSTKTKPGRDFYEYFNSFWKEIPGLQYSITIKELPDATRGSFLFVDVDETTVFAQRLNPRPDLIEEAAQQAVNRVRYHLARRQATQQHLEEEFQY